jgi:uncharacterized protein (TIGR02246 family)
MPAETPEEAHDLFVRFFNTGDIDSIISLYEPNAVLVPFPNPAVQGHAAIRATMLAFLSAKGRMELVVDKIFQADDLALLFSSWILSGTGPDGSSMKMSGQTTDVVRRQADGTWLFVLDVPQGAAAAKEP